MWIWAQSQSDLILLTVPETTDQPTKCIMHLIVYQCILCVYVFLWTICIEEVYILIYTPLLYVNYSTSIRYSWMINDCKLFLGYMCGNATQDKWKPTSVKYETKNFSLPAYTNIYNIRWLLTNSKMLQLSMLQTQRAGRWGCSVTITEVHHMLICEPHTTSFISCMEVWCL